MTCTGGTLRTSDAGALETGDPAGPVLNNLTQAGNFQSLNRPRTAGGKPYAGRQPESDHLGQPFERGRG
jgi:hypothetical protein